MPRLTTRLRYLIASVLCLIIASTTPALAGPRDAVSVLNRCGNPLKGDTTIFENTVTGGRRILVYERGTLNFDRVANDGWTFTYGSHGKHDHLSAEEMETYMPCLKDGLAAADAPRPLVTYTPVMRAEVSVKRDFKGIIIFSIMGLVLLGCGILLWARHERDHQDAEVEEILE